MGETEREKERGGNGKEHFDFAYFWFDESEEVSTVPIWY